MKILHVAPLSPYNTGWSYQENLLPKYQRKLGHEVWVIVSPFENTPNGKVDIGEQDFVLEDGVHVFRRRRFLGNGPLGKALSFTDIKDILYCYQPDFIMVHSLMTLSVFQVIRYKKKMNPNCVIIHDNHLDENIGKRKNKILTDLFYFYWKKVNRFSKPFISKYYGVTSWRRSFIVNRFGIEKEKTEILIMGADMEKIDFQKRDEYRKTLIQEYQLQNKFIIATGGKIEKNKNISSLMRAAEDLNHVAVLVFGTVAEDYQTEINDSMNDHVIMLGWKNSVQINELFLAADLAVFPGQHSVLWEQACACKIPCLFAYWEEMDHLNNGGNSDFMKDTSVLGIRNAILNCMQTDKYQQMLQAARSEATDIYSYYEIAKKSLECCEK